MRYVTKAILASCIIVFSLTAIGVGYIYTNNPPPQDNTNNPPPQTPTTYTSDFEHGMDNWTATGTDLSDPPIDWHINRTTTQGYTSNASLELYLNNLNDQGKIWAQQPLSAHPNTTYHVIISYMLGTSDYGMTTFTIITGADNKPPIRAGLTYQDSTDNQQNNSNLTWLPKTYEFITTTDTTGIIYTSIGVWGTFETNRTYYIDDIIIELQNITTPTTYPDLTGNWTITRPGTNNTENATITQHNTTITLTLPDRAEQSTGTITTNILAQSQQPTDLIIYNCTLNGKKTIIYINSPTQLTAITPTGTLQFTKNRT
jgi:hypothetical protein